MIILIDWNKSASARIWKVLRVAAENRKNKSVSNNKNTLLETGLMKMQIHYLPAGGAFGAAETAVSPVTAVHKAAQCS